MSTTIECTVKYRVSAYVTSSVAGQRASSTMDARTAVQRLGEKLLGESLGEIYEVPDNTLEVGASAWVIRSQPSAVQIGPTDI